MGFWYHLLRFLGISKSTIDTTIDTTTYTTTDIIIKTEGNGSKKRSLCVGINKYKNPSNNLKGCVNDGNNWASLFRKQYNFDDVEIVLDKLAIKANIKSKLKKMISESKAGDTLVFTWSGHGTSVRDTNGDESDKKDEVLCLYDGYLIDDEIREILNKLPKGVNFTLISDSCFSGSVSRAFLSTMGDESFYSRPRYMPPEDIDEAIMLSSLKSKKAIGYPEKGMNHILLSGTDDKSYSYDARIEGKNVGAFSWYAIKILKANPKITYNEFHKKLRKKLPNSKWPQKPQCEGAEELKKKLMFE